MKSPKDILALGQKIVHELNLNSHGTVMERWLAHHLAALITDAIDAVGPAKAAAEQQAVDVIVKLWMHRRALPEPVDPLGGYRDAVAVLSQLMPEANPWKRIFNRGSYDGLLNETFELLCRIVFNGILLTQVTRPRTISATEKDALEPEEIFLQEALEQWLPFFDFPPKPPKVVIRYIAEDASTETGDDDNGTDMPAEESASDEQEPSRESSFHAAIVTNLECMQTELATLLDRWKASTPNKPELEDDEA